LVRDCSDRVDHLLKHGLIRPEPTALGFITQRPKLVDTWNFGLKSTYYPSIW